MINLIFQGYTGPTGSRGAVGPQGPPVRQSITGGQLYRAANVLTVDSCIFLSVSCFLQGSPGLPGVPGPKGEAAAPVSPEAFAVAFLPAVILSKTNNCDVFNNALYQVA